MGFERLTLHLDSEYPYILTQINPTSGLRVPLHLDPEYPYIWTQSTPTSGPRFCLSRCVSSVIGADAGNGIRVFLPDIGMFLAGLACWLLCRSLFQKRPLEDMAQDNTDYEPEEEEEEEKLSLDENVLLDEDFEAGYEAGEEEEEEMEEEEEEEEEESTKMKILRHIAGVASKVKEIIGNLITTAGKGVVTVLLGLTGIMLPSLTSAVYFFVFLFLCTWWSFCRTFDTLIFSCMCVLMAIFSAGHLVVLYLYQFQFFQESIPSEDSYIRSLIRETVEEGNGTLRSCDLLFSSCRKRVNSK
ncbi:unnamed protein product [Coregonus sp. 'balchen']|nr:unnamed protein product [Coregonus sp. 'balchen']